MGSFLHQVSCNQICRAYGDVFFSHLEVSCFKIFENEYIYIIYIYINIYNENCLNGQFRNLNWSYLSYSLIWYFRFMKFPLVGPLSFSWFWRVWLGSETQHQTRRIISSITSRVMVRRRESPGKNTGFGESTAFLSLF